MDDRTRILNLEGRVQQLESKIRGLPRGGASGVSSGSSTTAVGSLPASLKKIFNYGFEWISNKVNVKAKASAGITVDASGVGVQVKSNEGLTLTATGLATLRKAGGGVYADSGGLYINHLVYVPSSVTVNDGTPAGGVDVSQVQVPLDGNIYEVGEVAATPGFDIEIGFTNVVDFDTIIMRLDYTGTLGHYIGIDIYNYDTSAWDQYGLVRESDIYSDWYTLAGIDSTNYIDSGAVNIRLYHYTMGNAAHIIYIDYAALLGGP